MSVDPFNSANIPAQSFGGPEVHTFYDKTTGKDITRQFPKPYSAYILFYERKQPEENFSKRPTNLPKDQAEALIPQPIYDHIWADNSIFLEDKYLFDHHGYITFLTNLCRLPDEVVADDPSRLRSGTLLLCEVMLYAKNKELIHDFVAFLASKYALCQTSCNWFIDQLLQPSNWWLYQFLLACPLTEVREEFAALLTQVLYAIREFEKHYEEPEALELLLDTPTPASTAAQDQSKEAAEGKGDEAAEGKKEPAAEEAAKPEQSDWLAPFFVYTTNVGRSMRFRLMDRLFLMLRSGQLFWKNFDYFFSIFVEFARFGELERRWLARRNAVACLIDFYLAVDSPYNAHRKDARTLDMGDKNNPPAVDRLVEFVSLMARRFTPEPCRQRGCMSPYQLADENTALSEQDRQMIYCSSFYTKAMRQNVPNFEAVLDTALHLCWGNEEFSKQLFEEASSYFSISSHSKFHPFFTFFTAFFSIDDELKAWRIDYGLSKLVQVVHHNLALPISSQLSITFLSDLSRSNPEVSSWLFGQKETYLERWLLVPTVAEIREATESLILSFAPSIRPLTNGQKEGSATAEEEPQPQEADLARHQEIYRTLLELLPFCQDFTMGTLSENALPEYGYPPSFFHLSAYFRLLRWCVRTPADIDTLAEHWDKFVELFIAIDSHRLDCDENKKEMLLLWVHCVKLSPRMIELSTSDPDTTEHLLRCHVSLPGPGPSVDRHLYFNNIVLSAYYHLLYLLAADNPVFAETASHHDNVEWAFNTFFLSSEHPLVGSALFDLLALLARRFPAYRTTTLPQALSRGIAHSNIIRLLEVLIETQEDAALFREHKGIEHLSNFVSSQQQYLEQLTSDAISLAPLISGVCKSTDHALALLSRCIRMSPTPEEDWDDNMRLTLLFALLPLLDHPQLVASGSSHLWDVLFFLCRSDPHIALGQAVQCILKNYQNRRPLPVAQWALQLCRTAFAEEEIAQVEELLAQVVKYHPREAAEFLYDTLTTKPDLASQPHLVELFLHFLSQLDTFDNDHLLASMRLLLQPALGDYGQQVSDILLDHLRALVARLTTPSNEPRVATLHQVGLDVIRFVKAINLFTPDSATHHVLLSTSIDAPTLLTLLNEPATQEFYASFEHCMSFQQAVSSLASLGLVLESS